MFEEMGLEEPQTWDEFMALNEKIKKEGTTPIALGTKEGWLLSLFHGIIGPSHYGGNVLVDQFTAGETVVTSGVFRNSFD
ncbi:extracellular solute-binding protein, partial [Micrococcus sp. SIMBA_131]